MRPTLFELELFGWTIAPPTYGFLLAVAFLMALWVAVRQARRVGVDSSTITDLWIASLLAGILGAKLLLYALEIDYYISNPLALLTTLRSAGVFYGGLLAAIGACAIIVHRRGLDGWLIGDIAAPALILGQAIGRWGCLASGCCYGLPTTLPWGVTFTDERAHEYTGVPLEVALHPTQIYLSLADLALFGLLLLVAARKRFAGQVFLLYLILYSILRGWIEIYRGDDRGEIAGLSTSQAIGIVVGLSAIVLYLRRSRRARAARRDTSRPRNRRGKRGEATTPAR